MRRDREFVPSSYVGWCEDCEKRVYPSAKSARRNAKRMPGRHMSTYPCPEGRGHHLGHLPVSVVRGEGTRDDYRAHLERRREAAS